MKIESTFETSTLLFVLCCIIHLPSPKHQKPLSVSTYSFACHRYKRTQCIILKAHGVEKMFPWNGWRMWLSFISVFGVVCDFSAVFSNCFFFHTVWCDFSKWFKHLDEYIQYMEFMVVARNFVFIRKHYSKWTRIALRTSSAKCYTIPHNMYVRQKHVALTITDSCMNSQLGDTASHMWLRWQSGRKK